MRVGCAGLLASVVLVAGAHAQPVSLVPQPKEVAWSDESPLELPADGVAIVLGQRAVPAEAAAADMLHRYVARRFGATWPIISEREDLSRYTVLVMLGQPSTNSLLYSMLHERRLDFPTGAEGTDGYIIDIAPKGNLTTVLVAGGSARGVTYGQDTLFQLLQQPESQLQLVRASIRDWASIAWRGRPMTDVRHYLEPGTWDGLISSRLNWIDLRNGTYAFDPEY
jgi:hypothetical protein